jgi:PAS domain S-box-containing protein
MTETIPELGQRLRAQQVLRFSPSRYSILFERNPAGIFLATPEGRLLDCNPSCVKILGYQTRADFLRRTVSDLLVSAIEWEAVLRQFKRRNHHLGRELPMKRPDGSSIWALVSGCWIRERRISLIQITLIDITNRKKAERRRRGLSENAQRLQDEERRRIARELHDSTAQQLSALKLSLGVLRKSGDQLGSTGKRALLDCFAIADECSRRIRALSHLLHPPLLDEFGLWKALRSYVDGFKKRSQLSVELWVQPDLGNLDLPYKYAITLFRVVQEALTNAYLHSGSKTVLINISRSQNQIVFRVKDRGRGLPAKVTRAIQSGDFASLGVGIQGMRERILQFGGEFKVSSNVRGTTLSATLPIVRLAERVKASRERREARTPLPKSA